MSDMKTEPQEVISDSLRKVLDNHGYGFQYSVLRKAEALFSEGTSKWRFEVAEYPVEVKGVPTRVDFILGQLPALYIVAECKRANPAVSNWCFVRAPYIRRNPRHGQLIIDEVSESGGRVYPRAFKLTQVKNLYHHGFEIKSGAKGEAETKGRGAIEEAATQVCRGINGIIASLPGHIAGVVSKERTAQFLAVIFTTARIWTSEVDLASASLETGRLDMGSAQVTERPWIWFQYNVSPGLKNSRPIGESTAGFAQMLENEFARSIAVVSPLGIDQFLKAELLEI